MTGETSHLPGPEYAAAGPQYVGSGSGPPNVYAMPLAEDHPDYSEPLTANTPQYDQARADMPVYAADHPDYSEPLAANTPQYDQARVVAAASNPAGDDSHHYDTAGAGMPVYAEALPRSGPGAAGATVYYDAAQGAGGTGAPAESDYALIPDQSGGTLPRQVALSKGSDTALWMHRVGRGGAEAVLEAAAAASPAVVRYLVRPKGAGFVLSICQLKTASKPRFFHDFIVAREDGQFTIKGKVGGSVIGVAGQVVETMSKNIGGTGSEPVLRGDGGLTASEVTDTFC